MKRSLEIEPRAQQKKNSASKQALGTTALLNLQGMHAVPYWLKLRGDLTDRCRAVTANLAKGAPGSLTSPAGEAMGTSMPDFLEALCWALFFLRLLIFVPTYFFPRSPPAFIPVEHPCL